MGELFGQPGCECCETSCTVCLLDCADLAVNAATVVVRGPLPATDALGTFVLSGTNCFSIALAPGSNYRFDVDVPGYDTQSLTATAGSVGCSITLRPTVGTSHWSVAFCCGHDPCGTGDSVSIDAGGAQVHFRNTRTGVTYSATVPAGANGVSLSVPAFDTYDVTYSSWPDTYFTPPDESVYAYCCVSPVSDARCRLWRNVERRKFRMCARVSICACDNETGILVGDDGAWVATVSVCGQTVTAAPTVVVYSTPDTMQVTWCADIVKSAPGSCSPYAGATWTITASSPWVSETFSTVCHPDLCSAVIDCGHVGAIGVDAYHACCAGVASRYLDVTTPWGDTTAVYSSGLACRWCGHIDFTAAGVITATSCTWDSGTSSWTCSDTVGTATVRVWFYFDVSGNLVVSGGLKRKCGDPGTCGGGDLITPCPTNFRWIAHGAAVTTTGPGGSSVETPYFTDPSGCDAPGLYTTACGTCPAAFWQAWSGAVSKPCPWDADHPLTATLTRPTPDPDCPDLVPSGPEGVWSFVPSV